LKIYSTILSIAQLTVFTIYHTEEGAESARVVRAIIKAEEQQEILRFEEVRSQQ